MLDYEDVADLSLEQLRIRELADLSQFPDDACGWEQATPIDTILKHQGVRTFATLNLGEEE